MQIKAIIYKYKIYLLSFIAILAIASYFLFRGNNKDIPVVVDALEVKEDTNEKENPLETYNIDIKGAVKNPGVYKVVKGSIINDVIEIAGGLKSNAYTSNINLSKKVSDEMVIYVYTKSEYSKANNASNSINTSVKDCNVSSNNIDISSCIKEGSSTIYNDSNSKEDTFDTGNNSNQSSLINLNTASKEELMTLNGIGESKALCIIEYRNQNGGFKSIEEIKNISGIGEASFAKIKDYITV